MGRAKGGLRASPGPPEPRKVYPRAAPAAPFSEVEVDRLWVRNSDRSYCDDREVSPVPGARHMGTRLGGLPEAGTGMA